MSNDAGKYPKLTQDMIANALAWYALNPDCSITFPYDVANEPAIIIHDLVKCQITIYDLESNEVLQCRYFFTFAKLRYYVSQFFEPRTNCVALHEAGFRYRYITRAADRKTP